MRCGRSTARRMPPTNESRSWETRSGFFWLETALTTQLQRSNTAIVCLGSYNAKVCRSGLVPFGSDGVRPVTYPNGAVGYNLSPANLMGGGQQQPVGYGGELQAAGFNEGIVRRTAIRFARDRRDGGMAGVAADVRRCYPSARGRAATLDCMLLDYVASLREAENIRQFRVGTNDYFESHRVGERLIQGQKSTFPSESEAAAFLQTNGDAAYAQASRL